MGSDNAIERAHRLLAPRIAYLIGTVNEDKTPNLIPVSNLTSVSTQPQQIALAVHKQWSTFETLQTAAGFTVSVPVFGQLEAVWKLGARYSHFPTAGPVEKLIASGLPLDYQASEYGPVLSSGIGWMCCRIIARLDLGGDHGIVIGQAEQVWFNPDYLEIDGTPRGTPHPVMQQTGNQFTSTADKFTSVPYF
ncbi:flavin reductase family protein [Nocardia tengchongensis]|uniref:flavin reductase family protein n=1 Tax=Nocardia tengchongensis TaxID=2055889 RepID=UPI003668B90D